MVLQLTLYCKDIYAGERQTDCVASPFRRKGDRTGERVKTGDADQGLSRREGESLHRRNADPQAGKRSRAGGHGVEIDVVEIDGRLFEEHHQIAGQPRVVRTIRIAAQFTYHLPVAGNRTTAARCARVQSEADH